MRDKGLIAVIQRTIREELAPLKAGYICPAESAVYMGISLSTFEHGPAREISCHRITGQGKRLYKREDLDLWMKRHRQAPVSGEQVKAVVDDVLQNLGTAK